MKPADDQESAPEGEAGPGPTVLDEGAGAGGAALAPAAEAAAQALEAYCARALDWPAVRALFERHALTSLGKRGLLELAPRPDLEARAALDRVGELMTLEGSQTPPFGGISDPLPALAEARRYRRAMDALELVALMRFLDSMGALARWLVERRERFPACAAESGDPDELQPLLVELAQALDGRGRLRDDASQKLFALRREIARLEATVDKRMRELAGRADLRQHFAPGHAGRVQRRGGRSLLAVRAKSRGKVPGIVHDRSQSGETLFVEPESVVEPANRLAGARSDAQREEHRILAQLSRSAFDQEEALGRAAGWVTEIELAFIGARWAKACDGRPARQPGMPGAAGELLLRGLRHPLLVEAESRGDIEACTPLDLRLGGDFDLLLITGPNTGGKTVSLKATGLALLLTRLGLPVAAREGTTVPFFDGVVADIGDEQEVRQNLSTFSSHLARIHAGLARAGGKTLFLLDELGGGTDPEEGAALGYALLETLLERGIPTLASTHLGRLKELAFRNPRAENASMEFDLESLAPTYHLQVGTPGDSRALAIARRLGFDAGVVERAERKLVRRSGEVEALMADVRVSREEAERVRGEAEERLEAVEKAERDLREEREVVATRSAFLEEEAERALFEKAAEAGPWLERAQALAKQLPGEARRSMVEALDRVQAALSGARLTERRQSFFDGLRKGDLVWHAKLKKRCPVARIDREGRTLVLLLGRQRLDVDFDDVAPIEGA